MTNMQEVIQTADSLATKSPWAWLIAMFLGYILFALFAGRYLVTKRDESNAQLLKSEAEKTELAIKFMEQRDELHRRHAERMEAMVTQLTQAQLQSAQAYQRVGDTLERFEKFIERIKT